jgi:hypothetical protein
LDPDATTTGDPVGTDIHPYAEVRRDGAWHLVTDKVFPTGFDPAVGIPYRSEPFRERDYDMFGLLAGVRNRGYFTPIAPRRGLPDDVSAQVCAEMSRYSDPRDATWTTLAELLAYDYGQDVPDGGAATVRDLIDPWFFAQLDALATLGEPDDVRVVMWFDS